MPLTEEQLAKALQEHVTTPLTTLTTRVEVLAATQEEINGAMGERIVDLRVWLWRLFIVLGGCLGTLAGWVVATK